MVKIVNFSIYIFYQNKKSCTTFKKKKKKKKKKDLTWTPGMQDEKKKIAFTDQGLG